jgi:glycerophosphoryl diester phosphodiesterase
LSRDRFAAVAATGASLSRRLPQLLANAKATAATLHYSVASADTIRVAHEVGAAVYVWTVDDAALAQELVAAGADGIITNDPRIFGSLKT